MRVDKDSLGVCRAAHVGEISAARVTKFTYICLEKSKF